MLLCRWWVFFPSVSFYLFFTGGKKKREQGFSSPWTCNLRQKASMSLALVFQLHQLKYYFSQDELLIFLLTQTKSRNRVSQSVTVLTQTVPTLIFLMVKLSFWFLFHGLRYILHSLVTDIFLMCPAGNF